jgi:hypothetical protein
MILITTGILPGKKGKQNDHDNSEKPPQKHSLTISDSSVSFFSLP